MDARVEVAQSDRLALLHAASVDRVTLVYLVAVGMPLVAAAQMAGGEIVRLLLASIVVSGGLTLLFSRVRGCGFSLHFLVSAAVFTLLMPPGVPLWQAMLALSFGIVLGEQVFGGRGFSFLHPSAAALAFLFFSFSGSTGGQLHSLALSIAVIPGAVLLLATRLVSWRILVGFSAGLFIWVVLRGETFVTEDILTSSLVIGLVFLICEPVSATSTNAGRWVYGVLAGVLVVLLGEAGSGIGSPGAIVFTSMLASIFAPLIDRIVVVINIQRRRRR